MSGEKLERRLQHQEDREAIRELRARYCWAIDEGKGDEFLNLFADDMDFDCGRLGAFKGKAQLGRFVHETISSFSKMRHLIHNEITKIEGEQAEGRAYFEFVGIHQGLSIVGGGQYEHKYIKIDSDWKFKAIKAVISYIAPLKEGWAEGNEYCGLKI